MQQLRSKLLLAMLLMCITSFASPMLKQTVNINLTKATLKGLFAEIERQTSYSFSYKSSDIDNRHDVTIKKQEASVSSVLSEVLPSHNLDYSIVSNNTIAITKASGKAQPRMAQASYQQKSKVVEGTITDTKGEPIFGATVYDPVSKKGTVTDINGRYRIDCAPGTKLRVSYVGYTSKEIVAGRNDSVSLSEEDNTLNDVVVVGYGTQKKVNLTGSVASLSGDQLTNRVESNVLSAIQGTVPGVTVLSRPGLSPEINFRGRGNLGTSAPLYVIDGVIADATFFSNLDPESIESISFLKDAASSAIYGSRAAYGVVLVTTKKGKKEHLQVSYNGMVGVKSPTYMLETVNSAEWASLYNEAKYNVNPSRGKNQIYTDEEIELFRNGSQPDLYPNSNWVDLTMDKHVVTTQHSINFSGGGDKIRYYLGGGYMYNDNFVRGKNDYRYNLDLSINADVTKWLSVNGGVKYIRNEDTTDRGVPRFYDLLQVPAIMVAKQSNGEDGSIAGGKQATLSYIQYNPVRQMERNNWSQTYRENTLYTLGADIKPFKGFKISAYGSYKRYEYKSKSYQALQDGVHNFLTGSLIPGTAQNTNQMDVNWSTNTRLQTNLVAYYDFKILRDHSFNLLAGTSYERYTDESLSASRKNFPSDSFKDLSGGSSSGSDVTNGSSMSEYKLMSYFGRINYSYKDKYLFEANIRADGSSRFYKDNRWGWFPSFSAGWRISEESFMKPVTWVDNLKLRASCGTLGNINNVGNYDYFQLYSKSGYYSFDDTLVEGIMESKPANTGLKWEKIAITDVGVDLDLFASKLSFTMDWYLKNTSDILLGYNVPRETGISSKPSQNIGKVRNQGVEFSIVHRNNIGDFRYQVGANFTYNKNKIVDMSSSNNMISGNYIRREGESIGSFYGLKTDGLYTQEEIDAGHYYKYGRKPNAGDIKYVPQRENVKWGDAITSADRTIIGCDVPNITYGVNLNLGYKDFELSMIGQGVSGAKVAFESEMVYPFFVGGSPRKFHLNRWTEDNPNPNAIVPRIYGGDSKDNYNQYFCDRNLFSADYFRIKTITFAYRLPKTLISKLYMSKVKLFLTAENLFTIRGDHKMKDFDPETASGRSLRAFNEKSLAFGISVNF